MATVREAVFDVMRRYGMTRVFANPGSTEVALLTDLPEDLEFVLALHEGSVVGMATGHALAAGTPALVLLHTTAGLGNAVGGIATARVNRAPLVIVVGQQDRRHLVSEPFLAGHLDGLAGDYPVAVHRPVRAADVPGAVARAWHEAAFHRGPVIVIVPMSDWSEPAAEDVLPATPVRLRTAAAADPEAGAELAELLTGARSPAVVAGPGADDPVSWQALAEIAERLDAPVWQATNAAQAGFANDHPRFRGHLPPGRAALRQTLAAHDVVLVVGAPAFRQGTYEPGPFVEPGTKVLVVTGAPDEAFHSTADLALVGPVPAICRDLAGRLPAREAPAPRTPRDTSALVPERTDPLRAEHVYAELAARLPAESTVIEESPSTRRLLLDLMPAREPFGFLTVAHGGLGFALPGATGVKMARPDRPVVALVGDGASLYNIQALWSAQRYQVGALFVVLSNGGYAVMDRLAALQGGKPPWPGFGDVSVSRLAAGFACPAIRVETYPHLIEVLDAIVPTLADRREPLLLDVAVTP